MRIIENKWMNDSLNADISHTIDFPLPHRINIFFLLFVTILILVLPRIEPALILYKIHDSYNLVHSTTKTEQRFIIIFFLYVCSLLTTCELTDWLKSTNYLYSPSLSHIKHTIQVLHLYLFQIKIPPILQALNTQQKKEAIA